MNRSLTSPAVRIAALLLFSLIVAAPVAGLAGQREEVKAAAAIVSAVPQTIEDVVARLQKVGGLEVALGSSKTGSAFDSRREIAVKSRNWDKTLSTTFFVVPSLPTEKVGSPPADFTGAIAVEVISSDTRYTVVAGSNYDPETPKQICTAAGLRPSKDAESRRLKRSTASWLDFRLAVARESDAKPEAPLPLANGPTVAQIDEFTKRFTEQGYNGGRRRRDPYLWFSALGCCDVSPRLATTVDRATMLVLLSDKPDEVLLSGSKRPRPWLLKSVAAARDEQGRPAIELDFDDAAAARIARLIDANPGRALALLFDDRVMQIMVIQGKMKNKLVVSGKAFDEKTVAGIVRALRECMVEPAPDADSSTSKNVRSPDGTPSDFPEADRQPI
jgi:hypothetical protein